MGFEKIGSAATAAEEESEDVGAAAEENVCAVQTPKIGEDPVKLWRPQPHRDLMPHLGHLRHPPPHEAAAAMAMAAATNPMLRQFSVFGLNHHASPFQHPKARKVTTSGAKQPARTDAPSSATGVKTTPEGKPRTFPCLECGKVFNAHYNLTRHMPVHTGKVSS